jgi:hypothetical protein
MAYVLVNPDGTSNAMPGDRVVTGGGIYEKLADGTSKLIDSLPTTTGKTGSYDEVKKIFSTIVNATGGGAGKNDPVIKEQVEQGIIIEDTEWNNDDFGYNSNGDYSLDSSSISVGSIIGYAVVGLVGIVIIDKLLG